MNLSALKESIKLLRNNGVLGVVVDRNQEQKGVKIKFFGYDTIVASGIAKMALRTNSPLCWVSPAGSTPTASASLSKNL